MTAFSDLPELAGVRLVTISNWFDGPLAGLAAYEGRTHWYEGRDPLSDDEGNAWEYVLYVLSASELTHELDRHEAFRQLVGTHWDLDDDGQRRGGEGRGDKASQA